MNEIKLDYDTSIPYDRIKSVLSMTNIKMVHGKVYSTKHGYHVYIEVKPELTAYDCLILQILMKSDWRRECFNFNRIRMGEKKWNALFNRKYKIKSNGEIKEISTEAFDALETAALRKHLIAIDQPI